MKKSDIYAREKCVQVAKFLQKIENVVLDSSERKYWQDRLQFFSIDNPCYIQLANEKFEAYYKSVSNQQAKRKPLVERRKEILEIIKKNPGLRPRDIVIKMGNLHSTDHHLRYMIKKEIIYKKREGKAVRYYIKE